jgi:hypothetical protein
MSSAPLSARAARVFYNAADAWIPPPGDGRPGGGDLDLVRLLDRYLPDPAERMRVERELAWLEWSPRLLLRSRRGFSWLPREERRAWLEALERCPLRCVRRAVSRLHALVDAAYGGRR